MSSKPTVLITGITGYIAGVTAKAFLEAGYKVRGTSRSNKSAQALIDTLASQGYSASDIEIYEVADITTPGAFDEAVKDVEVIAHLASPVSLDFSDPEPVIRTAKEGALSILRSSKAYGNALETFIQMSSIAAIMDPTKPAPQFFTEKDWNDSAFALCEKLGKNTPGAFIYMASKAESERAVWKFRDEEKPSFNLTAIHPAWVSGAPVVTPKTKADIGGTYFDIFKVFTGSAPSTEPSMASSSYIHVKDVARLFVWAAQNAEKANGERYLAVAGKPNDQARRDILRKAYPDRHDVIPAGEPGAGYDPEWNYLPTDSAVDTTKAVKATGQDWIKYDEVVLDTIKALEHLA